MKKLFAYLFIIGMFLKSFLAFSWDTNNTSVALKNGKENRVHFEASKNVPTEISTDFIDELDADDEVHFDSEKNKVAPAIVSNFNKKNTDFVVAKNSNYKSYRFANFSRIPRHNFLSINVIRI